MVPAAAPEFFHSQGSKTEDIELQLHLLRLTNVLTAD